MSATVEISEARAHALREAVERRRDELVKLACELVRRPSTVGDEEPAQALVDERLRAAGNLSEREAE